MVHGLYAIMRIFIRNINGSNNSKKAVLPKGNRALLQLFRSVFTAMLLHFLFQLL